MRSPRRLLVPLAFALGGVGAHLAVSHLSAAAPATPTGGTIDWDGVSREHRSRLVASLSPWAGEALTPAPTPTPISGARANRASVEPEVSSAVRGHVRPSTPANGAAPASPPTSIASAAPTRTEAEPRPTAPGPMPSLGAPQPPPALAPSTELVRSFAAPSALESLPRLVASPIERARAAVRATSQEPANDEPRNERDEERSEDRPTFDAADTIAWAAPKERDLLHRRIAWHDAVIDGVLDAQTQDKPLLLWLYFGGPLDDC